MLSETLPEAPLSASFPVALAALTRSSFHEGPKESLAADELSAC
jgi:hypothetical protein